MKYRGNVVAAIAALVCSVLLAWVSSQRPETAATAGSVDTGRTEQLDEIVDSTGQAIPCRDYQRIACASTIAADVLPHLISIDRIVLVPEWYRRTSPEAFRTMLRDEQGNARIGTVASLASIESLLAAKPDLVILNSLSGGGSEKVERLRELELNVLDLGPMLGLKTLLPNIRQLGQVVREAERGAQLARGLERRLRRVAQLVPATERRQAAYVGSMGGSLIGGTKGSSYHDLLILAGLIDAADGQGFSPWPSYTPESLLSLNPEIIVTEHGHTASLLAVPGMNELRAVSEPGGIVELPKGAETIGLGLLPAVEALHTAVYGRSVHTTEASAP
jgi:iron complex transport system substrate-binding protein